MHDRARSAEDKARRSEDLVAATELVALELGGVRFVTIAAVTERAGTRAPRCVRARPCGSGGRSAPRLTKPAPQLLSVYGSLHLVCVLARTAGPDGGRADAGPPIAACLVPL